MRRMLLRKARTLRNAAGSCQASVQEFIDRVSGQSAAQAAQRIGEHDEYVLADALIATDALKQAGGLQRPVHGLDDVDDGQMV